MWFRSNRENDFLRGIFSNEEKFAHSGKFVVNPLPPSDADRKQEHLFLSIFFQFSIVTLKKISPLWNPEIQPSRHFPKLKIEYFSGENPLNFS